RVAGQRASLCPVARTSWLGRRLSLAPNLAVALPPPLLPPRDDGPLAKLAEWRRAGVGRPLASLRPADALPAALLPAAAPADDPRPLAPVDPPLFTPISAFARLR